MNKVSTVVIFTHLFVCHLIFSSADTRHRIGPNFDNDSLSGNPIRTK